MKNVAVLGFAHGHIMAIAGEWKANPEYQINLVCGWDFDKNRLQSSTKSLGIECCYEIDEILSNNKIDAVIITSETKFHSSLAIKAAEAKKDIIMYKPMALTLSEADDIVEAIEKNGVKFTLAYQMRTDPQNIKIRELILNEAIGATQRFRRRHGLSTHLWADFDKSWHVNEEMNRDIFFDDAAHPIDMLNWIFGLPETVYAELSTMCNKTIENDNGIAVFRYKNGMIAEISCCFTCVASEITTEVYGKCGTILQYFGDAPSTRFPQPNSSAGLKWCVENSENWILSDIKSPASHGERLKWQAKPLSDFLHGICPPICSAKEARDSLRMTLACYLSNKIQERIKIDDYRLNKI